MRGEMTLLFFFCSALTTSTCGDFGHDDALADLTSSSLSLLRTSHLQHTRSTVSRYQPSRKRNSAHTEQSVHGAVGERSLHEARVRDGDGRRAAAALLRRVARHLHGLRGRCTRVLQFALGVRGAAIKAAATAIATGAGAGARARVAAGGEERAVHAPPLLARV